MKRFLKKMKHWQGLYTFLGLLISLYLKFVFKTTRWQFIGREKAGDYIKQHPVVACFWHNRVTMIPFMWYWPQKKIVALISSSPIGTILTKAFKRLNIEAVGGSSNRNPIASYRELLTVLKAGNVIGIIPDGPRGPAFQAKMGFIHLARKSGAGIIPLTFAISRFKTLNTWDKTQIPLPFSTGVFIYGDPIVIPTDGEDESYRLQLEKSLTDLQNSADNLLQQMCLEK